MKHRILRYTRHADMRLAQRVFRAGDVGLIVQFGAEVEGGYFMRKKDVQENLAECDRRSADRFERNIGKRVVIDHGWVITAYPTSIRKQRQLLRDRSRHFRR